MPINFTQTDDGASGPGTASGFCSGVNADAGLPGTNARRDCTSGGTAGVTPFEITLPGTSGNRTKLNFKCIVESDTSWNSGTWTWRLNVTTANMNMTLEQVSICRVNSSNFNQDTIGSAAGLGISLGTTGVKSGNITGIAQIPSVGDYVGLVFVFNNSAMTTQEFQFTPNQNIDSPFEVVAAFLPRQPYQLNQAVKRSNYW